MRGGQLVPCWITNCPGTKNGKPIDHTAEWMMAFAHELVVTAWMIGRS